MPRARAPLLVFVPALAVAIVGACGPSDPSKPAAPDASSAAALGEGICPRITPASGEPCVLPEGTTCSFGACGTAVAECVRGAWRFSTNPPPRPPCPDPEPPASESACPPCWPQGVTCRYGSEDCTSPDASANRTVASCPNGIWLLDFLPCGSANPTPPSGSATDAGELSDAADAGADAADGSAGDVSDAGDAGDAADAGTNVQGDGSADAD